MYICQYFFITPSNGHLFIVIDPLLSQDCISSALAKDISVSYNSFKVLSLSCGLALRFK